MKAIVTFLLVFCAALVRAQSVEMKLANHTERTWIGQQYYSEDVVNNPITYVFGSNHSLTKKIDGKLVSKKTDKWWIEEGRFINDSVILKLGRERYYVEFMKSSNGKDVMTLTTIPDRYHTDIVIRTFLAAD
jgi:hypothetical protein